MTKKQNINRAEVDWTSNGNQELEIFIKNPKGKDRILAGYCAGMLGDIYKFGCSKNTGDEFIKRLDIEILRRHRTGFRALRWLERTTQQKGVKEK